jgi:hypothetical protein
MLINIVARAWIICSNTSLAVKNDEKTGLCHDFAKHRCCFSYFGLILPLEQFGGERSTNGIHPLIRQNFNFTGISSGPVLINTQIKIGLCIEHCFHNTRDK